MAQQIALDTIRFIGAGLKRPECVLCTSDGVVHTSNWDGGISRIMPDGRVENLITNPETAPLQVKPNGICLQEDGSYLLAHLGDTDGGVFKLDASGQLSPFLTDIAGQALPPTNYVHIDSVGRIWVSVSTRLMPRALGYKPSVADGFVVLLYNGKARIVADDLGYTNECVVDPSGEFLYVNETFARRLSRFRIGNDNQLGKRETVATFGAGTYPDGMVFDAEGGIWITSIISNRVIRVLPDGRQEIWIEDVESGRLAEIEDAYLAESLDRPHLDNVHSQRLQNISSLAFGGEDLRSGYLGCLLGDQVAKVDMPVAGHPPAYWDFRYE